MAMVNGSFKVASWNEDAYDERDGHRLTRAVVSQQFEGDITDLG